MKVVQFLIRVQRQSNLNFRFNDQNNNEARILFYKQALKIIC